MASSKKLGWTIAVTLLIVLAGAGSVALLYVSTRSPSTVGPKRSVRYTYLCKGLEQTTLVLLADLDDATGAVRDVSVSLSPSASGCGVLHFDHPPALPEAGRSFSSHAEKYPGDPMWAKSIEWVKSCVPLEKLPARPALAEDWAAEVMHLVAWSGVVRSSKMGGSTSQYTEFKSQEFIDNHR